jgi:hypothetical protein
LQSLSAILFPRRWKPQLAALRKLLSSDQAPPPDVGERIDGWLKSPAWEVRNAAVKVIAHIHDSARYPRIVEKLSDRSEAGIVRRNAAEALARLHLDTDAVREALVRALTDPYWEARSEAARALAVLFPPDGLLEAALLHMLLRPSRKGRRRFDDNFEVRMAVAHALGHLGVSRVAFETLTELGADDSWPVRSQAAIAIAHLAARRPEFQADAREVLLALDRHSEGAVPYFVHRELLSHALRSVHRGPAADPEAVRAHYLNPKAGWNHIVR